MSRKMEGIEAERRDRAEDLERFVDCAFDRLVQTTSNGTPKLDLSFTSNPDTIHVAVTSAPTSQLGVRIVGLRKILVPFFGGTLVPSLDITLKIATDASGTVNLPASVDGISAPAGLVFYTQAWILDPAGTNLFAVTNGIEGELIRP